MKKSCIYPDNIYEEAIVHTEYITRKQVDVNKKNKEPVDAEEIT